MTAGSGTGAQSARKCSAQDCDETAIAGASIPTGLSGRPAYALIRRLTDDEQRGTPLCLDHAHYALDVMLMRQSKPVDGAR